jgi:lysine-N-methylase
LAVLGLFCESLTEALNTGGHSRLDQIMDSTRALIKSGQAAQMLESFEPQHHIQAVTFTLLWQIKASGFRTANSLLVQNAMAHGMGADSVTGLVSETQLVHRYQQGLTLLPKALKEAPQLMENYVLNEILHECFPFAGEHPLEQYFQMVTRFGLVRFMLAAQCQDEASLPSANDMARTVQVFARRYQHDAKFATDVNTSFKAAGWNQLDKVFRFLKP